MPRGSKNEKRRQDLRTQRKRRLRDEFVTPYQHLLPATSQFRGGVDDADAQELNALNTENVEENVPVEPVHDAFEDGMEWRVVDDPISDVEVERTDSPLLDGQEEDDDAVEEESDDELEGAAYRRVRGEQQRQLFRVLATGDQSEGEEGDGQDQGVHGDRHVDGEAALKSVSNFFVGLQARRDVPQKVIGDVVDYVRENADKFRVLLENGTLPTFRTMRYRAAAAAPTVFVDVKAVDAQGAVVHYNKQSRFPRKEVERRGLRVLYSHYYMPLQEVIAWHEKAHPNKHTSTAINLSIDGIPESRSSGLSLEVLSIRFYGCDNIYSIGILQPGRKGVKDKDEILLRPFVEDLPVTDLELKLVVADAPKRASIQGLRTHAATYGCPYCYSRKIEGKFPSSTFRGEERTNAEVRRIAEAIQVGEAGETRGVRGRSLLASVASLDIINDVPADGMHLVCLGVVRRMMNVTFKSGKRAILPYEPAEVAPFNDAIKACKSLAKFSRRPRDFDVAIYKSEEYRNLTLVYWPVLLKTAPKSTIKIWLLTVYIVRAYCLPDSLFNRLVPDEIETNLLRKWYLWYEKTFGVDQCTYSPHVFSHLNKLRIHGPLGKTSAVRYENKYATVKQNYKSGTTSVGTQALINSLLANLDGHKCKPPRKLSLQCTSRVDERFVYLRDESIFKLTHLEDGEVRGLRVPSQRVCGLLPGLDFSDVGVYRVDTTNLMPHSEKSIDPNDVAGKVVIVDGYASVMFWSMFTL